MSFGNGTVIGTIKNEFGRTNSLIFNQKSYINEIHQMIGGGNVWTRYGIYFHGIAYIPENFKIKIDGINCNIILDKTLGPCGYSGQQIFRMYSFYTKIQIVCTIPGYIHPDVNLDIINKSYNKSIFYPEVITDINNVIDGIYLSPTQTLSSPGQSGIHYITMFIKVSSGIEQRVVGQDWWQTDEFNAEIQNLTLDNISIIKA
jgi:hypothetical protein